MEWSGLFFGEKGCRGKMAVPVALVLNPQSDRQKVDMIRKGLYLGYSVCYYSSLAADEDTLKFETWIQNDSTAVFVCYNLKFEGDYPFNWIIVPKEDLEPSCFCSKHYDFLLYCFSVLSLNIVSFLNKLENKVFNFLAEPCISVKKKIFSLTWFNLFSVCDYVLREAVPSEFSSSEDALKKFFDFLNTNNLLGFHEFDDGRVAVYLTRTLFFQSLYRKIIEKSYKRYRCLEYYPVFTSYHNILNNVFESHLDFIKDFTGCFFDIKFFWPLFDAFVENYDRVVSQLYDTESVWS